MLIPFLITVLGAPPSGVEAKIGSAKSLGGALPARPNKLADPPSHRTEVASHKQNRTTTSKPHSARDLNDDPTVPDPSEKLDDQPLRCAVRGNEPQGVPPPPEVPSSALHTPPSPPPLNDTQSVSRVLPDPADRWVPFSANPEYEVFGHETEGVFRYTKSRRRSGGSISR